MGTGTQVYDTGGIVIRRRAAISHSWAGIFLLTSFIGACSDVTGQTTERVSSTASPLAASSSASADESGPGTMPTSSATPRHAPAHQHPLAGVAAIVEAQVTKVWNDFDTRLGPRTFVQLSGINAHAGSAPKDVFSQLGGPLPDGRFVKVSELPEFTVGARYILFFGLQASVYTPIWARHAFRVEQTSKKTIVLGPEGNAVVGFSSKGVKFGQTSLLSRDATNQALPSATFSQAAAEAAPELNDALSLDEFLADAVQTTLDVGGPIGSDFSVDPTADDRWDVRPTAAP